MAGNVVKAIQDWNAWILLDDRPDKYCDRSIFPFCWQNVESWN